MEFGAPPPKRRTDATQHHFREILGISTALRDAARANVSIRLVSMETLSSACLLLQ